MVMTSDELKEMVHNALYEAFNAGNFSELDKVFSPDLKDNSVASTHDQIGLEGFKTRMSGNRVAFPDMAFTIETMIVEGDYMAYSWTMAGIQKGTWMGRPATGKVMQITGMNMERFYKDKIVEHWSYPDLYRAMNQLGFN